MRLVTLIFSLLFSLNLFATDLTTGQQFLVSNIEVSEIAENAELAREKAIEKAQKIAFSSLLNNIYKITLKEAIDIDAVSSMVGSIEIHKETITDKTYSATVSVQFNEEFTRFYIKNNFLHHISSSPNILLIPVYDENGFHKLWQRSNQWLNVWNSIPKEKSLNINVPIGDFVDISNFKTTDLKFLDQDTAKILAEKYNVDKIIVATFYQRYSPLSDSIDYSVTLYELGDSPNNTLIAREKFNKEIDKQEIMVNFAQKTLQTINAAWVNFANEETDNDRKQEFLVLLNSVDDWQRIQKKLNRITIIENYELKSISARYAHISVNFTHQILESIAKLEEHELEISQGKEGMLILRND